MRLSTCILTVFSLLSTSIWAADDAAAHDPRDAAFEAQSAERRAFSPFRTEQSDGLAELEKYVRELPKFEDLSAKAQSDSQVALIGSLKKYLNKPLSGCQFGVHEFSVNQDTAGDAVLVLHQTTPSLNNNGDLRTVKYPLHVVGTQGNWTFLEDKGQETGSRVVWILKTTPGHPADLQIGRAVQKGNEVQLEYPEFFEESAYQACERRLMKNPEAMLPPSTKPFRFTQPKQVPADPRKDLRLAVATTSAQRKALKVFPDRDEPGFGVAVGPFVLADPKGRELLDRMAKSFDTMEHFRAQSTPVDRLKSFPRFTEFAEKHGLEIPEEAKKALVFPHPALAVVHGLNAAQIEEVALKPLFLKFKDKKGGSDILASELGRNPMVTRHSIDETESQSEDSLLHEWTHVIDRGFLHLSGNGDWSKTQAALNRQFEAKWPELQKEFPDANADTKEFLRGQWLYSYGPQERVAEAVQIAYLRDEKGMSFREIIAHLNTSLGRHRDASSYQSFQLALLQQYYDEKDLKGLLARIKEDAERLN